MAKRKDREIEGDCYGPCNIYKSLVNVYLPSLPNSMSSSSSVPSSVRGKTDLDKNVGFSVGIFSV